ncbi:acyl-[acyl-carrier-protein] thioesterase [Rhodococcus sp. IEGM 1408]|uniref:acyl-[acyl-carrier-protein] thioesterase n=1 Tax=Rhodococcus sp. IEGM 1408 TaxID=3082220 RepID=UPI002954294E|nr:acyl-ACP thioesterase domain-containing protein [Rhodococcus sp. IEGM 1408]MDV8002034.1 thioesterase [Rhodococcus sp. IEGM 1408]
MSDVVHDPRLHPLPEPPSAESGFSASLKVRTGDVDPQLRLRFDSIARYLQDLATDDLDAAGHTRSDPFWIVRRTVIDVVEPITWPATVHQQRWCSGLSTRWANMRVRLSATHQTNPLNPRERPDGLVETEAFWINVNPRGVPTRISADGFDTLAATTDTHRLRWESMTAARSPEVPGPQAPADRGHILRSTDFDPLQHLNNAAYFAAVEDELLLHPDLLRRRHRAVIEYFRPVVPGSAMTIRRRRQGNCLQLWMAVDDQVVAAATVTGSGQDA